MRTMWMRKPRNKQAGFTLLELLIAVSVAAVGFLATMMMFVTAITTNSRTKRDTTATLLSETVMEQIIMAGTNGAANIPLSDCLGNNFIMNTTGAVGAAGAGAALDANGNITFGAAAPGGGYSMNYWVCRADGSTAQYDVRWNVREWDVAAANVYTRIVYVSTRPVGQATAQALMAPITLKGITALQSN